MTWRSKKQDVVSLSSAEAEYRALTSGIKEGMWLHRVLGELQMPPQTPIQVLCDSKSAISIVRNPIQHDKTKHVELGRQFISEKVTNGVINRDYVPTSQQLADVFTKSLSRSTFEELIHKLWMFNIYTTQLEGECRNNPNYS